MMNHTHPLRIGLLHAFVLVAFMLISATRVQAAPARASADERIAKAKIDLKSPDTAVRLAAIKSLVHSDISGRLLAEIRTALNDSDADVRSVAATAVGNVGAPATVAIPQLIAQLKGDPSKEARETAARALGRIGKAAPDEKDLIDPLQQASQKDADPVTRVVALGALAMIGAAPAEQIAALRTYLHHDDPLVRMKASHALGMIGKPAKAASAEIVDVLQRETDHHRRGYVARALGNVGDPAALPALEAALNSETDPDARGEMRGAIGRLKALASEKTN